MRGSRAAALKGTKSCRTQGDFHLSIHHSGGMDFRPDRRDFRTERADFKPEKADFSPERSDFEPERSDGGDERNDRMTE